MKPVLVFFETHYGKSLTHFFSQDGRLFCEDNYTLIGDEGVDQAIGIERLLAVAHFNDEFHHRNNIYSKIASHNKAVVLQPIDTYFGRYRAYCLNSNEGLLPDVNVGRDKYMAQSMEQLRRQKDGLIVILGFGHFQVQHWLLKLYGKETAQNYRFFYLYDEGKKLEVTAKVDTKIDTHDALPLGLCQIDCEVLTGQEIYRKIKQELANSPSIVITENAKNIIDRLDDRLRKSGIIRKQLLRFGIVQFKLFEYMNENTNNNLDGNKLVSLLVFCLQKINSENAHEAILKQNATINLGASTYLIDRLGIDNRHVDAYQLAVDQLLKNICQEFSNQRLFDSKSDVFFPGEKTAKTQPSVLNCCGIFAITVSVIIAGIVISYLEDYIKLELGI